MSEYNCDDCTLDCAVIVESSCRKALIDECKQLQAELKANQWLLSTIRDLLTYNEYKIIDLKLIENCLNQYENSEPFTKEEFSKIHMLLVESGLTLLPTSNKIIEALKEAKP